MRKPGEIAADSSEKFPCCCGCPAAAVLLHRVGGIGTAARPHAPIRVVRCLLHLPSRPIVLAAPVAPDRQTSPFLQRLRLDMVAVLRAPKFRLGLNRLEGISAAGLMQDRGLYIAVKA
jgi:hypothetical protein